MDYILVNNYGQYLAEPDTTADGRVFAKYTTDPRRAKDFRDIWQAQEYALFIQRKTGAPIAMEVARKGE